MLADETELIEADPVEQQIQAFEAACGTSVWPDWHEFGLQLCDSFDSTNLNLLCELAAIDLELRWKRGPGRQVEVYLEREPRLKQLPFLLVLIAEEYRSRSRCDAPTHDEFRQRFPSVGGLIAKSLSEVDREQVDEKSVSATGNAGRRLKKSAIVDASDPRATLDYSDFILERFIGGGGSGRVYRAYQRSTGRHLAVKYMKKAFQRQPQAVERFVSEAQTIAKLCHPGIVRLHGLGQTPHSGYFVAMDWLPAGDLNRQIELGSVSVDKTAKWVRDTAMAIQYAHEQGVIHCDLKPANLLLGALGNAIVTDFGLARSVTQLDDELRGLEGTAGFMAPEQATSGWGSIGTWTDAYGLGAVLYALLTGHAPYRGSRSSDILSQLIANRPIPSVSLHRTDIPKKLEELCLACLDHDPRNRPGSAKEIAERSIVTD